MKRVIARLVALLTLGAGLVSCSRETRLGTVSCDSDATFSIGGEIPSKNWPSRLLYFSPRDHDGYSESIYEANVTAAVSNAGDETFKVTAPWASLNAVPIEPGSSISLPEHEFKDWRITVIPAPDTTASIMIDFSIDRAVTSAGMWRLLAVWSDGP